MSDKRLRVFAGPNGSGKSTFFDSFRDIYNSGIFINADEIEKELSEKGFIDLSRWNLTLSRSDLEQFLNTPDIQSFIKKSVSEGHSVSIQIKDNIIFNPLNFLIVMRLPLLLHSLERTY